MPSPQHKPHLCRIMHRCANHTNKRIQIILPTRLRKKEKTSLKEILDRGATINYVSRFRATLACMSSTIVCLSQEDGSDSESMNNSTTQEDVPSRSILFLSAEKWPIGEPLVTPSHSPWKRTTCALCKMPNHMVSTFSDLEVLRH